MHGAGFIEADGERERVLLDKATGLLDIDLGVGIVALGPGDGDNLEADIPVLLVERLQLGQFAAAWRAPRFPECDDRHLAVKQGFRRRRRVRIDRPQPGQRRGGRVAQDRYRRQLRPGPLPLDEPALGNTAAQWHGSRDRDDRDPWNQGDVALFAE